MGIWRQNDGCERYHGRRESGRCGVIRPPLRTRLANLRPPIAGNPASRSEGTPPATNACELLGDSPPCSVAGTGERPHFLKLFGWPVNTNSQCHASGRAGGRAGGGGGWRGRVEGGRGGGHSALRDILSLLGRWYAAADLEMTAEELEWVRQNKGWSPSKLSWSSSSAATEHQLWLRNRSFPFPPLGLLSSHPERRRSAKFWLAAPIRPGRFRV